MPPKRNKGTPKKAVRRRFKDWLRWVLHPESPLPISAALLCALIVLGVLAALYTFFPGLRPDYWQSVYVEATGFLFDLLFFGVALAIVLRWQDRKHTIARYEEEIQDFKRWSTDEGRLRIAGAVRRLVKMGKTDIDFTGMKLGKFSFRSNDIGSIGGSTFYEGEWGMISSREQVDLNNVDFSFVNCSNVVFSAFNPFEGIGIVPPVRIVDCSFQEADLRGAVFNGATLEWTKEPPDSLYEEVGENPDGSPGFAQSFYPAFDGADLAGASFKNAQFKNADFRRAENILKADFSGAKGLERGVFDNESVKAAVLKKTEERAN